MIECAECDEGCMRIVRQNARSEENGNCNTISIRLWRDEDGDQVPSVAYARAKIQNREVGSKTRY